jgi:hypothetical protein
VSVVCADEGLSAIVFFDEVEKMHPDVYTALMNYFDAATLTAGNGQTVRRPGHVLVGAANSRGRAAAPADERAPGQPGLRAAGRRVGPPRGRTTARGLHFPVMP